MNTFEMQNLINIVKETGDDFELASGIYLVRGDAMIEVQKSWEAEDESKGFCFDPEAVYWWGDGVKEADATQMAECY